MWDTYCCLCGIGTSVCFAEDILDSFDIDDKKLEKEIKFNCSTTSWLDDFGVIIDSNKYISSKKGEYEHSGYMIFPNYSVELIPAYGILENPKFGFLVHKLCYNMIKNKKNIYNKLLFLAAKKKRTSLPTGYLEKIKYGNIKKWANDYFEWEEIIEQSDGDMWMFVNPSIKAGKRNKERIKKIIAQIEKENRSASSKRSSPSQSATSFKVGTKSKGNDGNIWIVKKISNGTHRWVKY